MKSQKIDRFEKSQRFQIHKTLRFSEHPDFSNWRKYLLFRQSLQISLRSFLQACSYKRQTFKFKKLKAQIDKKTFMFINNFVGKWIYITSTR